MADLPEPDSQYQSPSATVYDPQRMPPTPEEQSGLHAQWTQFLANPDNRAALFQAGVALLQPIGVGQTVGGHIAQAIGMAGETVGARQEQRNQMANESLARQLAVGNFDLSGKRLGLETQQEERLGRATDANIDQGERGLRIQQQNADSATTRANRPSSAGQLTENRISEMRQHAADFFNGDWQFSPDHDAHPDTTQEQFIENYLRHMGVPEEKIHVGTMNQGSAGPPTAGDVTAAPKGTGPSISSSTPPVGVPDAAKISANQYLLRYAPQWAVIQGALQSADPATQQKGQAMYQRVLGGVKDPENLPQTRPPILGPISPTSVPTQEVPAVPPPPPVNPTPWGGTAAKPVPYLPTF